MRAHSALIEQYPWLEAAQVVLNDLDALSVVNDDVLDLLEEDDLEGDPLWLIASCPLQLLVPIKSRFETDEEWVARLGSLRSLRHDKVLPIILFIGASGAIQVIDGHHRIALAMERGQDTITALVRCEPYAELCIAHSPVPGMSF